MFDNAEIDTEDLPRAQDVTWQSMDEKYVRRLYTQAAIALVSVTVGIGGLQLVFRIAFADEGLPFSLGWLWLVPLIVGIAGFTWPPIGVAKKGYAIRDKDIVYKSGVFWHTATAIPFNRIQHVEKSSTPLDRRFSLATLQLFTAGGSGGDLKIHGLPADQAEDMRTFILEKVGNIIEHH